MRREARLETRGKSRRLRGGRATDGRTPNAYAERVDSVLTHDQLFDVVIDSCRVGLRKPDPRIFALALEPLGIDPPNVLFVDDQPGTVASAAALGMQTITASDYSRIAEHVHHATTTAPA